MNERSEFHSNANNVMLFYLNSICYNKTQCQHPYRALILKKFSSINQPFDLIGNGQEKKLAERAFKSIKPANSTLHLHLNYILFCLFDMAGR